MIAARIVQPHSKLATTRWFRSTTLPDFFNLRDASAEDLYDALDWLLQRQQRIQAKLARRHFAEGGLVLLDLSSSYFEGAACPLARYGYNRDGKQGKLQVNYGLLCDLPGRPVAVTVWSRARSTRARLLEARTAPASSRCCSLKLVGTT